MSFEIITDSSANLPNAIIDRYGIHIMSLCYYVGDKEFVSYVKGSDNDLKSFYQMMRRKEKVTTACISPDVCYEAFEEQLRRGNDLFYIGFSSGLSATFQVAHNVLEELKAKYPDRKIFSSDTLAASLGEGLIVAHAAKLKAEGRSIEEVYDWVENNKLKVCHWFTVDDLFFLKRGGRVSASAAIVGTMLGIKPILHMDNEGHLAPVSKARGRKNALNELVFQMEKEAVDPAGQTVYISHGDCIEDAQYVAEAVKEKFKVKEIVINAIEPVIGAHSGPGTLALFFIGTQR